MSQREQVIAIIAEVLETPLNSIRPEVRFVEDLGVSSLQLVDVVWRLEEVLDLPETQPSSFQAVHTVQDMIDLVDKSIANRDEAFSAGVGSKKDRIFDVALGSDHAGVKLKSGLADLLRRRNYLVADMGPQVTIQVDYPDFADKVTSMILEEKARFGVLICGSGIGMSIAANRHPGIRAALVTDPVSAKLARKHNNANVLCLGARLIGTDMAEACLDVFLSTAFDPGDDGRHRRRIEMLEPSEKEKNK